MTPYTRCSKCGELIDPTEVESGDLCLSCATELYSKEYYF